jgi:desulfoferrodoxin (superoxide reductase-like protein)
MKLQRNLHNNECDHNHRARAAQLVLTYTNLAADKKKSSSLDIGTAQLCNIHDMWNTHI